jgi:hypothetical protein
MLPTPSDRSDGWIRVTLVVQLLSFFLYPAFICGCHFFVEAIPVSAIPIIWGFYPYFFYRTKREHLVGYANGALSVFWMYLAWDSNLQFAFAR